MATLLPPSSSDSPPPSPFAELLKSLPVEIRARVQELLRKAGIINDEDLMLHLMAALGLYATYFEKIPQRITDAGMTIDTQNAAHLAALDPRLRVMREFALVIQNATDRLGTVPQEIVDKFPALAVAEALKKDIDAALKTLPLSKFEESVNRANTNMGTGITNAKTHNDKIEAELSRLQRNTADIANLALPNVSGRRAAGFAFGGVAVGAAVAALLMWWFLVKPLQADEPSMKEIDATLNSESFIGNEFAVGHVSGQKMMVVRKGNFSTPSYDAAGNLLIPLSQ